MPHIRLVHWKLEEAIAKARILEDAGYDVCADLPAGPKFLKNLEAQRPDAVVIDLSRIPSQGRDIAVTIRSRKGTRHIPLVFVGGDPARVGPVRNLLPDATYSNWNDILSDLEGALKTAGGDVVVPASVFAAYSGKPLAGKLGIKAGSRVAHIGSPAGFISELGELPPDTILLTLPDGKLDLVIWFAHSLEQLRSDLEAIVAAARGAPVWIAWPKKGSIYETDLTQQVVRSSAMSTGLVDYKICSIDSEWSALLFTWRGIAGESK
jgi:hypothetical protein